MKFVPVFFNARRLPVTLQSEAAECGLACMTMIAAYFGRHTTLRQLRQLFACGTRGATLKQLTVVAESLQLVPRAVRVELNEIGKLRLPCILHWRLDHFVVLEKVAGKSCVVVDPATGRRRVKANELGSAFSGVALELTPAADFVKKDERDRLRLAELLAGSTGTGASLLIVLCLSLTLQLLALLLPFYSQIVIDDVVLRADLDLLQLLLMAFVLVVVLQALLSMGRAWIVVTAAAHLNLNWSTRVFRHLLRLPLRFFESRHVGDIQSRFASVASLNQLITRQAVAAFIDGLMALTTCAVMFAYAPRLALLVLLSVLAYFSLRLTLFLPMRTARQELLAATATRDGFFLESLRGILAIKSSALDCERQGAFLRHVVAASNAQVRVSRLDTWQLGANSLIFGLQMVLVTWLGATAIVAGEMTIGMLVAFLAYRVLFTERAAALIDKGLEFRLARIHLERLADIVKTAPEHRESATQARLPMLPALTLATRDLGFRHTSQAPHLLAAVNLRIHAGEHVVISGASGVGKTTLMKLLMGLWQPTEGQVLINGMPLLQFGLQRYRRHIAAVMQEDQLFSGSLLDNISLFDPQADIKRCRHCAWLAGIDETIDSLPLGYFTPVGDMGAALSGGQKQRVLLARALYRRPRLLFLDEFTSHLDAHSESIVNERLASLPITRIVIAHDAQSVNGGARRIHLGSKRSIDVSECPGAGQVSAAR